MIRPSALIEYMRDNRTSDTWKVDYAANYQRATDQAKAKLELPAFYVELSQVGATNESDGDYLQGFTATIRVRLVCLSTQDKMGRTGADVAYEARLELFRIFLDQQLGDEFNHVYYVGDSFEGLDDARYIHSFEFGFSGQLDYRYVRPTTFDPLNAIDIDYNLVESPETEYPNAESLLNTFQD